MNLLSEAIQFLTGERSAGRTSGQIIKYRGYIKEGRVNRVSLKAIGGQFITLRISYSPLFRSKRIPRCRVSAYGKGISMSEFSTSCHDKGEPNYYLVFHVPFPGNSFIALEDSKIHIFRLLRINEMRIESKRIRRRGKLSRAPILVPATLDLCGSTHWVRNLKMYFRLESYVSPTDTVRGLSIVRASLTINVPRILVVDHLSKLKIKHNMEPYVFVGNESLTETLTFKHIRRLLINWSTGWISDMENCDVFPPFANMCSSPHAPIGMNDDEPHERLFELKDGEPYEGLFELKDDAELQEHWIIERNMLAVSVVVFGDLYSQTLSQCYQ